MPRLSMEMIHRSSTRAFSLRTDSLGPMLPSTAPDVASLTPYLVLSSARVSSTDDPSDGVTILSGLAFLYSSRFTQFSVPKPPTKYTSMMLFMR